MQRALSAADAAALGDAAVSPALRVVGCYSSEPVLEGEEGSSGEEEEGAHACIYKSSMHILARVLLIGTPSLSASLSLDKNARGFLITLLFQVPVSLRLECTRSPHQPFF